MLFQFKVLHQFYKVSRLGEVSLILYSFSPASCHLGMLFRLFFHCSFQLLDMGKNILGQFCWLFCQLINDMLVCGESVLYYFITSKEWTKNWVLQALESCLPQHKHSSGLQTYNLQGHSVLEYFNAYIMPHELFLNIVPEAECLGDSLAKMCGDFT